MDMYAVNRKTREHRPIVWGPLDEDEDLVQSDEKGWINYRGDGESPLPSGVPCFIKERDGWTSTTSSSCWDWSPATSQIVKYLPDHQYLDWEEKEDEETEEVVPEVKVGVLYMYQNNIFCPWRMIKITAKGISHILYWDYASGREKCVLNEAAGNFRYLSESEQTERREVVACVEGVADSENIANRLYAKGLRLKE